MGTTTDDEPRDLDPELATLLERAARPVTPVSAELRGELAAMTTALAADAERPVRRVRVPLVASLLAPLLVLGGAGAAFAAANIDWSSFWHNTTRWADWAEQPDAIVTYVLPGGGSCELRLGEVEFSPDPNRPAEIAVDERSAEATRAFFREGDVLAGIDLDAIIAESRTSDENFIENTDGSLTPFGYGTDAYDADVEFNDAVKQAVHVAVTKRLDGLGLPSAGLSWQSQEQCTGVAG
ncbi:hypothetical protein [Agromyces sp. NPDC058126]|uniref:hypothetical protein n=1 Tax=Agromyces sp. NPDC058126 TaxID=3346350 RepID=UPI0036D9F008